MTPTQEQMNADLLKWAGWEVVEEKRWNDKAYKYELVKFWKLSNELTKFFVYKDKILHPVNYFTDDNAIRELEEIMSDEEWEDYIHNIHKSFLSTDLVTNLVVTGNMDAIEFKFLRFARHTPTDVLAEAAWKTTCAKEVK